MRISVVAFIGLVLGAATAFGSHPKARELERVQAIAHELEDAARHVYYEAKSARHHFDHGESYGLRRLRKLGSRARHFHRQVEKHRLDPYHVEEDYLELREAYYRAAEAMRALHAVGHVRRDFERVAYLMRALDGYFVGHSDGRFGYRGGHARPDHRRHLMFFFDGWWRW